MAMAVAGSKRGGSRRWREPWEGPSPAQSGSLMMKPLVLEGWKAIADCRLRRLGLGHQVIGSRRGGASGSLKPSASLLRNCEISRSMFSPSVVSLRDASAGQSSESGSGACCVVGSDVVRRSSALPPAWLAACIWLPTFWHWSPCISCFGKRPTELTFRSRPNQTPMDSGGSSESCSNLHCVTATCEGPLSTDQMTARDPCGGAPRP